MLEDIIKDLVNTSLDAIPNGDFNTRRKIEEIGGRLNDILVSIETKSCSVCRCRYTCSIWCPVVESSTVVIDSKSKTDISIFLSSRCKRFVLDNK